MTKKNTTYYTKHTILTSPHHITYTKFNDNGTKEGLVVVLFVVICGTDSEFPLCLSYRIRGSAGHSVGQLFPLLFKAGCPTRHNLAMYSFALVCPRCRTLQYLRGALCFVMECA